MRVRPLLLLLSLAAACGDGTPIADEELLLRIRADADEVLLGQAFPLTVVRVWSRELTPAVWHDEVLAPLSLRLVETTRREDDRRIEETRRYDGYVFSPGEVVVPAPTFRALPKNGGAERSVEGNPIEIRVRRALDPARPGPAELPDGPLEAPIPWLPWSVGGAALLTVLVLLARRPRRAVPAEASPAPQEPPPGPEVRALERIERLRGMLPGGREEVLAFHVEAAGLLRDYVGERFDVRAGEMTTQELVSATREEALRGLLGPCDLVKFARHSPAAVEREELLDAARTFVEESA